MVSQAPSRDPLRPSRRLRGRSVLSGHPSRTVRGRGRLPGPPPRGAPAGRDHRGDSERAPAAARRGGHHVRRWLCRQLPPRLSDPPALRGRGDEAGDRRFESVDRGAGGLSSALFCVSERRLLPLGRRSGGGCGPRGRIRRGQPGRSGSRGTLRDWSEPLGTRSGQRLRCRGERTSRRTSLAWITLSQIHPLMWQTRAYHPEDLGPLAEFLVPLGDEGFSSRTRGKVDAYYRWKYGNGSGESNRVRVAVGTEGLIGVVALLPRCIKLDGRILTAFEMGDILTAAGYRRQGVFSALGREACQASASMGALSYVKPNADSAPVALNRRGFRPLVELETLARPIRISRILAQRVGHLFGAWGRPLDKFFAVRTTNSRLFLSREATFTDEFDRLWE